MPNPYAHGLPADPVKDFAGREAELKRVRGCVESSRAGNLTNVFIEGEWGIGKTSLLNKLRPELEEYGLVISEDLSDDEQQIGWFFNNLFAAIADELPDALDLEAFHDLHPGDSRRLRKLLKTAWDGLRDKHKYELVVIMLDNLERARPNFLTNVRDVFQRLTIEGARYMLVFAGRTLPAVGTHASDPVARFFNPRIPLHAFDETTGIEAIKKPVRFLPSFSFADDAARLIHGRAAGHPHFLKLICHHVYALAEGEGEVDASRLEALWPDIEERLVDDRFGRQFADLSDGEQRTLLHASLLGSRFEARELRGTIKSLDTFLDRLRKAELLRSVQRGVYELYHPLFRTYLQALAAERKLESTSVIPVDEGRPAKGRLQIEECFASAAEKKLDILDQHFRGRAVAMLESVAQNVRVRILMGDDPAWPKTEERFKELELGLRKRIEVRAWPDKSDAKPIPWHYRAIIGDREVWSFDHSLDGAGKKKAYLRDDTARRATFQREFNRWWKESKQVFPRP